MLFKNLKFSDLFSKKKEYKKNKQAIMPEYLAINTYPVFLVGHARSGSSALVGALRSAGIPGWPEGHIFQLLVNLIEMVENYYTERPYLKGPDRYNALSMTGESWFKTQLINMFVNLHTDTWNNKQWFDKTPGGTINIIPTLAEIFPNAKFIFSYRRGIEAILSRQRKFTNVKDFEQHCKRWDNDLRLWATKRKFLNGNYIEIEQRNLSTNPELVSKQMAEYLNFNDIDANKMKNSLLYQRQQQTQIRENRYISLEETEWTDQQKQIFVDTCGEMMELFGFSIQGEDATDEPLFLFYDLLGKATIQENIIPDQYQGHKNVFSLKPNLPGNPIATVTYDNVLLTGHNRFISLIYCVSKEINHPVYYGIKISKVGSNQILVSDVISVISGEKKNWEVNFKSLTGRYDVSLANWIMNDQSDDSDSKAEWKNSCFLRSY